MISLFGHLNDYTMERGSHMYSKEYLEARKEFINCLLMSVIGLGVPVYIAFKEWWPIMQAEKRKGQSAPDAIQA